MGRPRWNALEFGVIGCDELNNMVEDNNEDIVKEFSHEPLEETPSLLTLNMKDSFCDLSVIELCRAFSRGFLWQVICP